MIRKVDTILKIQDNQSKSSKFHGTLYLFTSVIFSPSYQNPSDPRETIRILLGKSDKGNQSEDSRYQI